MTSAIIDNRTGRSGTYDEWVAVFTELWAGGRSELDRFMSLLSPDVRLIAPILRSTTGWDAGREAFRRAFDVFPDLTASVHRWSASGDTLFIEMTFRATVGRRVFEWSNVDRFLFRESRAVERVAYFNPLELLRALARSPRGWVQAVRLLRNR
jgi:hypothetical protein